MKQSNFETKTPINVPVKRMSRLLQSAVRFHHNSIENKTKKPLKLQTTFSNTNEAINCFRTVLEYEASHSFSDCEKPVSAVSVVPGSSSKFISRCLTDVASLVTANIFGAIKNVSSTEQPKMGASFFLTRACSPARAPLQRTKCK